MALVLPDRVKETATTAGTGTFTLAGAVAKFQSFSAVGDGNTTYYCIQHETENEFEVGLGTYTASGTTLSRDTILTSTNSNNAVNFSAGDKTVFVVVPGDKTIRKDGSGAANITSSDVTTALGFTPVSSADGGNAATLDSLDSTQFLRSDAADTMTGDLLVQSDIKSTSQIRATGWWNTNTGTDGGDLGVEIGVSSSQGYILSYNRNTSSYGALNLSAEGIDLDPQSGSVTIDNDVRAPIFYDSGDTSYYADPASTSIMNAGRFAGSVITGSTSGSLSGMGALNIYRSSNPWIAWYSGSTSRGAYIQYVGSGDYFNFGEASYINFDCNIRHEGQYNYNDTAQYIWWSGQTYGNFRTGGGNVNGYSGIEFSDSANDTTLMIRNSDGLNGVYRADAGTWFWYTDSSSNWRSYGNVTAYASDERLKNFYGKVESSLEKICQIDGLYYEWDEEACSKTDFTPVFNKMEIGLKAQQVEALFPEVVELAPFDTDPMDKGVDQSKSGENYLTLHYERLVPVLIEAIKELKAEIDVLKGVEND